MKDDLTNIPFQVVNLIEGMMNKNDSHHIRGNYRMRLDAIREVINSSIKKFDDEMFMSGSTKRKTGTK